MTKKLNHLFSLFTEKKSFKKRCHVVNVSHTADVLSRLTMEEIWLSRSEHVTYSTRFTATHNGGDFGGSAWKNES